MLKANCPIRLVNEDLNLQNYFTGAALAALIGWLGLRQHALSRSGALGALLIGTAVFGDRAHLSREFAEGIARTGAGAHGLEL